MPKNSGRRRASKVAGRASAELRTIELRVDPTRTLMILFVSCVLVELALVFLDYHVNYGRWTEIGAVRRLFNTAREDGLASCLAVVQTLLVALTAWFIYCVHRSCGSRDLVRWSWCAFALLFTYMAIDDGSALHERVATAVEAIQERAADGAGAASAGTTTFFGFPSYTWQVVYLPFFAGFGLYMLGFLYRHMRWPVQRLCLILGLGAFAFAVALDFAEGLDPDHPWNLYAFISNRYDLESFTITRFLATPYDALEHFSKSIEETSEMFGMTLLWIGFLSYLFDLSDATTVRFRGLGWRLAPMGSQGNVDNHGGNIWRDRGSIGRKDPAIGHLDRTRKAKRSGRT